MLTSNTRFGIVDRISIYDCVSQWRRNAMRSRCVNSHSRIINRIIAGNFFSRRTIAKISVLNPWCISSEGNNYLVFSKDFTSRDHLRFLYLFLHLLLCAYIYSFALYSNSVSFLLENVCHTGQNNLLDLLIQFRFNDVSWEHLASFVLLQGHPYICI